MTITMIDNAARPNASALADQASPQGRKADQNADDGFTFDDLIDIINPLQHLPIVSTIYRAITGDEISVKARAVGGGLFGGPIGLLAAGATMAVEEATGLTAEGTLASVFSDGDTQVAALSSDAESQRQSQEQAQAQAPQHGKDALAKLRPGHRGDERQMRRGILAVGAAVHAPQTLGGRPVFQLG